MSAARGGERGCSVRRVSAARRGERSSSGAKAKGERGFTHRETQLEGELVGAPHEVDEAGLDEGRAGHLLADLHLPTQVHSDPNVTI